MKWFDFGSDGDMDNNSFNYNESNSKKYKLNEKFNSLLFQINTISEKISKFNRIRELIIREREAISITTHRTIIDNIKTNCIACRSTIEQTLSIIQAINELKYFNEKNIIITTLNNIYTKLSRINDVIKTILSDYTNKDNYLDEMDMLLTLLREFNLHSITVSNLNATINDKKNQIAGFQNTLENKNKALEDLYLLNLLFSKLTATRNLNGVSYSKIKQKLENITIIYITIKEDIEFIMQIAMTKNYNQPVN